MKNNYINKLQFENQCLKNKIATVEKELEGFRQFLNSEKFTGVESDGSRKDWIATADVINFLREIKLIF